MKLIVGLGNPGPRYARTRHNVGYRVLATLARRFGSGSPKSRFEAELMDAAVGGERVLLLSPLTFMNRSGRSVEPAVGFYKLEVSELLVVCDDFNLPLGRLRFRPRGSSGGQKGLEDILQRLGTDQFARLRIGIGPVPDRIDPADFVLGRFAAQDEPVVDEVVERAADGAADWVTHGVAYCMNRYNAEISGSSGNERENRLK